MAETIHISELRGKTHAAIITIRHDEYDAVERWLPDCVSVEKFSLGGAAGNAVLLNGSTQNASRETGVPGNRTRSRKEKSSFPGSSLFQDA